MVPKESKPYFLTNRQSVDKYLCQIFFWLVYKCSVNFLVKKMRNWMYKIKKNQVCRLKKNQGFKEVKLNEVLQ